MNCCHARQLISPYLDDRLTGREMLALGEHLARCGSCADEMRSLREVKLLLRGLHAPGPRLEFSRQISAREIGTQSLPWHLAAPPARPQRGRRLLTALALSCLTVLAFAPASREGRVASAAAPSTLFSSAGLTPMGAAAFPSATPTAFDPLFFPAAPSRRGFQTLSGTDASRRTFFYAQPYSQAPPPFPPEEVSLSAYRSR